MPVQFRDYYETLGVSKTATQDEIRSAFRKLARKYHPDVAADKVAAEEKFKEINEAYEVLGDPEKRKKYDEYGSNWQQGGFQPPPPGYGGAGGRGGANPFGSDDGTEFHFGGTGFSDFFEQMFGNRRARGGGGGGWSGYESEPMRGQDGEADLLVTLEEAFHGSTRQISFRRGDSGKVETYTVRIPKGVREGQRIRLAGQGGSGAAGGSAGDLFLRVKFQKHPDYEVNGLDLYYDMEVPAWEAVLGSEIAIPTLEGRAKVKIQPGTQSGKHLRLPGRGLPGKGDVRGDFYAVVQVTVPTSISASEQELWQKIAALHK